MKSFDVEWYHRLPDPVKEILSKLRKSGRKAYVVGGAVRDLWLGLEPKDFDLVSEATPEEIEALFPKTLDVGRSFGIMIVVTGEGPVEVARFRADGAYTDSRRPDEIRFASPEEDARRRDFTINALFYDPDTGKVLDYVGGVEDLKARLIRTVGDAKARFEEDALRMLRAVRFHAQLIDFQLEPTLLRAIRAEAQRLKKVSRERVTQEMEKVLLAPKPSLGLLDLRVSQLWEPVFQSPAIDETVIQRFDSLRAEYLRAFSVDPGLELFWAAAEAWIPGHDPVQAFVLGRDVKALLPEIQKSLALLPRFSILNLAEKKQLCSLSGWKAGWAILSASGRLSEIQEIPGWCQEREAKGTLNPPALLSGKDLMGQGFKPGPGIKKILDAVREKQLNEEISTREEAMTLAEKLKS